jgi:predicted ester cyclase
MSPDENKVIVHRYLKELVNDGNFAVAVEILEPDYVNHTAGGGIGSGRDAYVEGLKALRTAFPDWHVAVQAMICEGDVVSDRLVVTATHTGQSVGVAPTGIAMNGEVLHMWRIANGRLAEGWYFGTPSLMSTLFAAISPA